MLTSEELISLLDNERKKFALLLSLARILFAIVFFIYVYYLVSMMPEGLLRVSNFLLLLDLLKKVMILLVILIIGVLLMPIFMMIGVGEEQSAINSIFIAFAALLVNVDIELFLSGQFLSELQREFSENILTIVSSIAILVFIIAGLLFIGFLRRGALEYLLASLYILFVTILFSALFTTYTFVPIEDFNKLFTVEGITVFLSSKQVVFFILTFVVIEIAQFISYVNAQFLPLSERLSRIINQVKRLNKVEEKEKLETIGIERERELGEKRFLEIISPLGLSIIRDAFEGYAFLGEGTTMFINAKLKAYTDYISRKREDLLVSISGLKALPKLSPILFSMFFSLVSKIIASIVLIFVSLLLLSILVNNLGGGIIIELTRIEAFIFANFAVLSLVYVVVHYLSPRIKRRYQKIITEI